MKSEEKIRVYVDIVNGETVCICTRRHKGCDKQCAKDVVTRDRYEDWESTMRRNKYGK